MFDHVSGVEKGHGRRYRLSVRDLFMAGVALGYPQFFNGILVTRLGSGKMGGRSCNIFDIPYIHSRKLTVGYPK